MKTDLLGSVIIGFLIAVLFISISYSTVTIVRPDKAPPLYYWSYLVLFPLGFAGGMFVLTDLRNKIGSRFFSVYQFYKFAIVSGLNILLYTIIYTGLIVATQTPEGDLVTFFKSIGFMASVINSYFWNKYWTFRGEDGITIRQLVQFLLVSTGGLGIYISAVYIIQNAIEPMSDISPYTQANIGQALAIIFASLWNFLGYKYVVFRKYGYHIVKPH